MASTNDSTLKIFLQTQADISGVTKVTAGLKELEAQAAETGAVVGRVTTSGAAEAPGVDWAAIDNSRQQASEALNDAQAKGVITAEQKAIAEQAIDLQMSRQVVLAKQLEAAQATLSGDGKLATQLEREAEIRLRSVGIQRTLNVTSGEAIALSEKLVLAQEASAVVSGHGAANLGKTKQEALTLVRELAAGNVQASTMSSLLGSLGGPITIAGIAAYELYHVIAEVRAEAAKIELEIDKQAAAVEKEIPKWEELARAASNFGDVVKLGATITPTLDQLSAKSQEIRNKEISGWTRVGTAIAAVFTLDFSDVTPWQKADKEHAAEIDRLQKLVKLDLDRANSAITRSQAEATAWEVEKKANPAQAIADYTQKLAMLKAQQAGIDRNASPIQFDKWQEFQVQIEQAQKRLEELTASQTKLHNESDKVAESIKKADFEKLDSSHKLESLQANLTGIHDGLKALGVDAATPAEALAKIDAPLENGKRLTAENQQEVIRLAGVWGQVISAINGVINAEAQANAQLASFQDKLAVTNAYASGSKEEAYKAEWGAKYNKILAERQKIGADTSSTEINNQIWNEQQAERQKKEWAEQDRGSAKVAGNQREITTLTREQSNLLSEIRGKQQAVQQNPFMGADQKQAVMARLVAQEIAAMNAQLQQDIELQKRATDPGQWSQLQGKIQQAGREVASLGQKLKTLSFGGSLRADLTAWANQFGNTAKQISGIITNTLNTAIASTSQALTNLIFKTGSWKEAFASAAKSIVQNIIQVLLQWIISKTIMSALSAAFGKADAKATEKSAAASAAAWAPAATAASIATEGSADISGTAALAIAMIAGHGIVTGLSAAGSATGYFGGGWTGGREGVPAGVVHGEEVVIPAKRVREVGKEWAVRLAVGPLTSGGYQGGGYVSTSGGSETASGGFTGTSRRSTSQTQSKAPIINIFHFTDENELRRRIMATTEGHNIIVDAVNNRRVDLGLR